MTASLERFRALTEDMKKTVHADAVAELNIQANELAKLIAQVAPVYQGPPSAEVTPGALKQTVRVIPDAAKDTVVRVVAGGQLTKRAGSSKPYDYSRADEFGTREMAARPFFFPSYRLRKKSMIAAMKRRIAKNIKNYSAEK